MENRVYLSMLEELWRAIVRKHAFSTADDSIREIENVELLLTHDLQLATAARILGFEEM